MHDADARPLPPTPSRHRLREGLFRCLKAVYRPIKAILKPVLVRSRTLNRLCVSLKRTIENLVRPPAASTQLPQWLMTEWKAMGRIEPLLFPEESIVSALAIQPAPSSRIARTYLALRSAIGSNVSHVIVVPWIREGGSDLETLNYVRVLAEEGLPGGIVVLSTETQESTWQGRLPAGTRFVEMGRRSGTLDAAEREILLARILLQLQSSVIHNMNSELAYRVFVKYGRALSQHSRLYTSVFCTDVSEEGRSVGYSHLYLSRCYDSLTAVLCDNQTHLDELVETYALDRAKMHVHYQPAPIVHHKERKLRSASDSRALRVLWAGRLDRQKRPDLLAAVARKCHGLSITFDVYGAPFLTKDVYSDELRCLPNVEYKGRFDGLPSLPVEDYDVLLYTSEWDGLPNVLLESLTLQLPVIASGVGGIRELIEPGKTGFLVDPFDDVDQYVACLKQVMEHPETLPAMVERAKEVLATRHSWEHFRSRVRSVPGYVAVNAPA